MIVQFLLKWSNLSWVRTTFGHPRANVFWNNDATTSFWMHSLVNQFSNLVGHICPTHSELLFYISPHFNYTHIKMHLCLYSNCRLTLSKIDIVSYPRLVNKYILWNDYTVVYSIIFIIRWHDYICKYRQMHICTFLLYSPAHIGTL